VPDERESAREHGIHRARSVRRRPALLDLIAHVTATSCAITLPPVDTPRRNRPFWHAVPGISRAVSPSRRFVATR
jgi:hypothetical protein